MDKEIIKITTQDYEDMGIVSNDQIVQILYSLSDRLDVLLEEIRKGRPAGLDVTIYGGL